jgi:hypothetical protein
MRCCSWLLMGVMLLKLSLGSVMALPISWQSHLLTPITTAHQKKPPKEQTKDSQFSVNTQTLMAAWPDCHGHSDTQADKSSSDTPPTAEDTSTPCTSLDDCRHCCAVGLGHWADKGQQTAPSGQPQLLLLGWKSANFRPLFRPPIA